MKLAIDLGGTNARVAKGTWASHTSRDLKGYTSDMPYSELVSLLLKTIKSVGPERVGISAPGPIYPPGLISPSEAQSPNIRWHDENIQADLNQAVSPQVYVQRDVSCAALSVLEAEDAAAFNIIYPGTGFGFATVHDSTVMQGYNNTAGELAELDLEESTYDKALSLQRLTELDNQNRSPETVLQSAPTTRNKYMALLARASAPLIAVTAPNTVFIGGHLAEAWGIIGGTLTSEYQRRLPYEPTVKETAETPLKGAFLLGDANLHF